MKPFSMPWWGLLAVTLGLYLALAQGVLPRLETPAGPAPDLGPRGGAALAAWLESLAPHQRAIWFRLHLPLDLALIAATGALLIAVARWWRPPRARWRRPVLFGLVAAYALADLVEDGLVGALLAGLVAPSGVAAVLAAATALKFAALGLALLVSGLALARAQAERGIGT